MGCLRASTEVSMTSMASESHRDGKVNFKVGDETYQTWYKVLGSLNAPGMTPLVVLHGGPGMTHHYML